MLSRMNNLKKNQHGFGIMESLLIVVIIVMVGTIGWIVYRNQGNDSSDQEITLTQTNNSSQQSEPMTDETYVGWKQYSYNKIEFKYPPDWLLNDPEVPEILSPDYASTGLQKVEVTIGSSISIMKTDIPQPSITADNYETSDQYVPPSDSGYKKLKVGTNTVGQYITPDGTVTIFFRKDGTRIVATSRYAAKDKEESLATYNLVLSSVKVE